MGDEIVWPVKQREMVRFVFDSRRMMISRFNDDIVIATWSKSGTDWVQRIFGRLVFDGAEGLYTGIVQSPRIDFRLSPGGPAGSAQTPHPEAPEIPILFIVASSAGRPHWL